MVRGRVGLVPAHHQQLTIGKLNMSGAEEVIGCRNSGEGAGGRVPYRCLEGARRELIGVVTRTCDEQHIPVLEKCGMNSPHG